MRILFLSTVLVLGLSLSARSADTTVKISDVHLCCKACVTGVEKAVGKVEGVTVAADQNAETVTLTGPDAATVQKAADALVAGGYFGTSDSDKVKVKADTGAKGQKVESLTVEGVHLCCRACVTAVDEAVKAVPGVKEHNAQRNAKTFTVTGDFNDKEVFDALQKAGLSGKAAK